MRLLASYAASHPEMKVRLPSPKAKRVFPAAPMVVDRAAAKKVACEALHAHLDQVFFSTDPEGAGFREAVLGWRPSSEWPQVQAQFHAAVDAWGQGADCGTDDEGPGPFWFSGSLSGFFTEVKVGKSGELLDGYVEVD